MSERFQVSKDGLIQVQAWHLTEIVQAFTKMYPGEHTVLDITTLAIMHGIQIGYDAAKEEQE